MKAILGCWLLCLAAALRDDEETVFKYVSEKANETFREPSGFLSFPYLVPAGPYEQLWDWDSVFMGVGLLPFGSAPYLAGSMKNFLSHTNLTTGEVEGCLTPDGSSGTIYHAKPVVIHGAWLAAKATGDYAQFLAFQPQMMALLGYWDRTRLDTPTGLYVWHDQLESGADNLPTSPCPSPRSDCWDEKSDAFTLASTDIMSFLHREHEAYALFCDTWANNVEASNSSGVDKAMLLSHAQASRDTADRIREAIDKYLWTTRGDEASSSLLPESATGLYLAYNVSAGARVNNRVYLLALPLFANLSTPQQAALSLASLASPDMLSDYGVRSTSSLDPSYNNDNIIVPYSNWQGPVWVVANALLAYGAAKFGQLDLGMEIAERMVHTLAEDLAQTGTWHESYSAETGQGLAANGFLSWNTLGATLLKNLREGIDPFEL
eukprot:c196_g1_i1.p1 GENE.c196_g1_i1~~c196_g1_i1.p1  ORF type:complete len:445 (+),score=94.86 c196_g1_i1:33-1337(+)